MKSGGELPSLTAEGVLGAAFSVIYARLIEQPRAAGGLWGPLMATIVLPYRGHAAAARELARPAPALRSVLPARRWRWVCRRVGDRRRFGFRLTQRTQMVLAAVAEYRAGSPSNREVSDPRRSLTRVRSQSSSRAWRALGCCRTPAAQTQGVPNAWQLTPHGEEILRASTHRGEGRESQGVTQSAKQARGFDRPIGSAKRAGRANARVLPHAPKER